MVFRLFVSIIIILIGIAVGITVIMIIGFIVLGMTYIQAFMFCRCPYSSHSFMTISGFGKIRLVIEIPQYCPKCGKEVN